MIYFLKISQPRPFWHLTCQGGLFVCRRRYARLRWSVDHLAEAATPPRTALLAITMDLMYWKESLLTLVSADARTSVSELSPPF